MAKILSTSSNHSKSEKVKVKRPGVVAKSKTSRLKGSKLYKKPYRSQGR